MYVFWFCGISSSEIFLTFYVLTKKKENEENIKKRKNIWHRDDLAAYCSLITIFTLTMGLLFQLK